MRILYKIFILSFLFLNFSVWADRKCTACKKINSHSDKLCAYCLADISDVPDLNYYKVSKKIKSPPSEALSVKDRLLYLSRAISLKLLSYVNSFVTSNRVFILLSGIIVFFIIYKFYKLIKDFFYKLRWSKMKLEVKNKIKETEDFYKEIEIIALNRSKAFKILGTIPDDSFENVSKAYHSRLNEYQSCISEHLSPDKKNDILKKIEEVEWAFNLLYPAKK